MTYIAIALRATAPEPGREILSREFVNRIGGDTMNVGERRAWFALRVRPKHEITSAAALRSKGYEEFVPTYKSRRRWSDRVKEMRLPLFAGYIFCRFDQSDRLPVVATPGVVGIVGFGKTPSPVCDSEIHALQSVAKSGLPAEPFGWLQPGKRVKVTDGPLHGIEGVLLRVKQDYRLVISITLLQRSVAVEVDGRWIIPA